VKQGWVIVFQLLAAAETVSSGATDCSYEGRAAAARFYGIKVDSAFGTAALGPAIPETSAPHEHPAVAP
jgi:hypothetical protein